MPSPIVRLANVWYHILSDSIHIGKEGIFDG